MKRIQEIAPDKEALAAKIVMENQFFYQTQNSKYVPKSLYK